MPKKYLKETYKTKSEWLKARGIGSSDASAICGSNKWKTIDDVYSKLVLGIEKEVNENELMVKGTLAEDHIRQLFELNTGYKVINPPKKKYWLFRRKDYNLMTCTPDGLFRNDNNELCGLEIKYVDMIKKETKSLWENDLLPDEYYYQCLQYFVVLDDLKSVVLSAYMKYYKYNSETNTFEFDYAIQKQFWVHRKDVEKHIEYVFNKEKDFIENNVNKRQRPKLTLKI